MTWLPFSSCLSSMTTMPQHGMKYDDKLWSFVTAKVKQWPAVPRTILSGYAVRSIPKENIKKADLVDKILAELDKVYLKDATSRWFGMRNKNVKKGKKDASQLKVQGSKEASILFL